MTADVWIASKTKYVTQSGRVTSRSPLINTTTSRKAHNSKKRLDEWLKLEAMAEAKHIGCDYWVTLVKGIKTVTELTAADTDMLNSMLWGIDQPAIEHRPQPSLFKEKGEMSHDITRYEPSEEKMNETIRDYCKQAKLLHYHTHRSDRSEPGFPDWVIIGRSGVHFAEFKRWDGDLTEDQAEWIWKLRNTGYNGWVVRGAKGLDTFIDALNGFWQASEQLADMTRAELEPFYQGGSR